MSLNGLPENWEVKKLGAVCEIFDGQRRPINRTERATRIAGKPEEDLYPYFGATGQVGFIDGFLFDGEYVLLGEDGAPFLEPFKAKAYLVRDQFWVNNHAHILKSRYSNKFLCYYLNQISYGEFVTGTTRLKLNQSAMKDIPCVVPPMDEQERIVAKIEELFSELDAGVECLKKAQGQLKTYRQAVLKSAFDDPEGKLPKYLLKDASLKIQIGPFGTQLHREDYVEGGIPLINPMHIKDGQIVANSSYSITIAKRDGLANYILQDGDVILGRRGEMGRSGLVTEKEAGWLCGSGSLYFRPKRELVDSAFLHNFLQSQIAKKYLEENAGGTTMANLNLKIVGNIPISLPPVNQQRHIVEEIESRLSVCDKLEETIAASLKQSEALRQSILKQAFEGRLVSAN